MIVSINKLKSYRPTLPIGMITVATQLKQRGYEVACVDLMFEEDDEAVIRRELAAFQPDVVGISIRNVDSLNLLEPAVYTPLAHHVASWVRDVQPQTPVVLGGAGFTTIPEEMMKFVGADYGIAGFAESSFPDFIQGLEQGRDLRKIDGILIYQNDGTIFRRDPKFEIEYRKVAAPDYSLYDARYWSYVFETHDRIEHVAETIQTKKGCVLDCIFCSNFLIDGTGVILKSPAVVADEVERILERSTHGFEIVDGVFNLPLHHAIAILSEFVRRGINHPWSAMINPGAVNAELVDLMVKTGCREVELGTDSCNDRILTTLGKNFRKRKILEIQRLFDDAKITTMHCLFIGSPDDDRSSIMETFDVMDELVPDGHPNHHAYWTFGLRICRGTQLYERAKRERVISADEYFIVPKYYVSPTVLQDDALLDDIEARVLANRNWYLWWGLPNISLRNRIRAAYAENARIEAAFLRRFSEIDAKRSRYVAAGGQR